jgi:hypothetical protein
MHNQHAGLSQQLAAHAQAADDHPRQDARRPPNRTDSPAGSRSPSGCWPC